MDRSGTFVHPTALVDGPDPQIGAGTRIWHWVHIMPGAQIGERCSIGQGCYLGKVRVGNGCRIQNHVSLFDGVTLEDDVFLGPSCVFTNVTHPRAHVPRKDAYAATWVGRGATVGANATIVCGVTIGAYAMIGAGAVVPGCRGRTRSSSGRRPPDRLGVPVRRDPAGLARVPAVRRLLHRERWRAGTAGVRITRDRSA